MAGKRMPPYDFARPGLFEPFGRTLMCLQLGHSVFLGWTTDLLSLTRVSGKNSTADERGWTRILDAIKWADVAQKDLYWRRHQPPKSRSLPSCISAGRSLRIRRPWASMIPDSWSRLTASFTFSHACG